MSASMPTATTLPSPPATTADPKRTDLFKPLYKRDRALKQSRAPASLPPAITDPRLPVAALNANESIPYTFRTQPYRLQGSAESDSPAEVGAAEWADIRSCMHAIFHEHGFLDEASINKKKTDNVNNDSYPYSDDNSNSSKSNGDSEVDPIQVLTIDELPGAAIITGFLPIGVQARLIELVIEELIGDPRHKSNLDAHYVNPQALLAQLFKPAGSEHQQQPVLAPRDPAVHAPLPLPAVRDKKLRWITLGGQYNWTTKVYPSFARADPSFPEFPPRVAALFSPPLFAVRPEAAIVNFYSQGDVLSPHQDVAERCNADLISLSVGCDAVFYIGLDRYDDDQINNNGSAAAAAAAATNSDDSGDRKKPKREIRPPLQVLLRSGDILIMGGATRFAYHGVGRVFQDTAPSELVAAIHPQYRDWLRTKRINVNVRQMLS